MSVSEDDGVPLDWTGSGRPEGMSELEWLVAHEELRLLKARRDRYVDANDWAALEALHAPDHVSYALGERWNSPAEMIQKTRPRMEGRPVMHASFGSEILFDTPTSARGIWSMIDPSIGAPAAGGGGGGDGWRIVFGYYYETYEKRNGRWLFTSRRFRPYLQVDSEGAAPLAGRPKGSAEDAE